MFRSEPAHLVDLRASFKRWLEWNEEFGVRAAYERLKHFPENLPNERQNWNELRAIIGQLLDNGEEGIANRQRLGENSGASGALGDGVSRDQ